MKLKLMQTHTIWIISVEFLGSNPWFKLECFWLFPFFSQALFSHLLSSVHDCSDLSCCILHTHVHVCVSTYFFFHLIHSLAFITTHGYDSSVNRELNWDRSEMVKGLKAVGA